MAAVSIVNGNVWVNMWATAYALPMWRRTHGGAFMSAGTKGPVVNIYIYLCCSFPVGTLIPILIG